MGTYGSFFRTALQQTNHKQEVLKQLHLLNHQLSYTLQILFISLRLHTIDGSQYKANTSSLHLHWQCGLLMHLQADIRKFHRGKQAQPFKAQ